MSHKRKTTEKTGESDLAGHADSREQETGEAPSSIDEEASAASADAAQAAVDRYLRLAAEFENYKKRVQKDQAEYIKYANERLLRDLLPVLDNLQRALEHAKQSDGANGLVQGVELTCKQYEETLSRFGVRPIPSVGLPFDPAVHQAVAMVEAKEGRMPNTIVAEHEKGYYLYDRVLRPAMVTVAASNKDAENQEQ